VCESHLRWRTFIPNLGTLGEAFGFSNYSLCTRRTDRQMDGQKQRLLLLPYGRGIITCSGVQIHRTPHIVFSALYFVNWPATLFSVPSLCCINPLMGTLKPHSNGPLYSNTVIGTLATDEWAVTLVQRGGAWVGCSSAQSPPLCIKCNSPPINGEYTMQLHNIRCGSIVSSAL